LLREAHDGEVHFVGRPEPRALPRGFPADETVDGVSAMHAFEIGDEERAHGPQVYVSTAAKPAYDGAVQLHAGWSVLRFASVAFATDGGVMVDSLPQDAVGDLVRREFGTLRDGLERVEPGSVWFTKPDEPRFVTVELTVVPLAPVGGWNVRVTRLLGHDWRVQVDRRHLRLMSPPRLVEQLEAVLATRQVALASAKLAAGCERAVSVEAARVFPPGATSVLDVSRRLPAGREGRSNRRGR